MKYESHNKGHAYMRRDCWILLSIEVVPNVQNKWLGSTAHEFPFLASAYIATINHQVMAATS